MKRLLLAAVLAAVTIPALHAQSFSPRLFVLNTQDATLVTVDPATGEIVGTVATGEGPHEVAGT
jgi:glucose dehydrogenase